MKETKRQRAKSPQDVPLDKRGSDSAFHFVPSPQTSPAPAVTRRSRSLSIKPSQKGVTNAAKC